MNNATEIKVVTFKSQAERDAFDKAKAVTAEYLNTRDDLKSKMDGNSTNFQQFLRDTFKMKAGKIKDARIKGVEDQAMIEAVDYGDANKPRYSGKGNRAQLIAQAVRDTNTGYTMNKGKIIFAAKSTHANKAPSKPVPAGSKPTNGTAKQAQRKNEEPGEALTFDQPRAMLRVLSKGRDEAERVSMALEMLHDMGLDDYVIIPRKDLDAELADDLAFLKVQTN